MIAASENRTHCFTTLAQLNPGEWATVASIDAMSPGHLRKLLAFGLLPGTRVRLLQATPVAVVEVGYTRLALDPLAAHMILVKRE
ncbi:MAG: FeoA family protein [Bacillota bacterium]